MTSRTVLKEPGTMVEDNKPWLSRLVAKLRSNSRRIKAIESSLEEIKALTIQASQSAFSLRLPLIHRPTDAYDLRSVAELEAALSSAKYLNQHLSKVEMFDKLDEFLKYCVDEAGDQSVYLEFGVLTGRSIRLIAKNVTPGAKVYGFDSFEGLPEKWRAGFQEGKFAVDALPEVPTNVELIKGWFDETLPDFASTLTEKVGFVHVDCDLYSSTKTIFECLHPHFKNEVIIVFDEYFNYPGWEQHEYKAFQEYVEHNGYRYEYISCMPVQQQVAVRMFTT